MVIACCELFAGVHLELLGDRHVFRAFEGLRVHDVGDDRLVLARQIFLQSFDQVLAGDRALPCMPPDEQPTANCGA